MLTARATQFVDAGIAAAKVGETVRARAAFRKAIEIDPNHAAAWLWSAGVAENPIVAVRMLERVLRLEPDNAAAKSALKLGRFEAGVAAAQANRRAEACTWLRQVCADDPNNEAARLWLAGATDDPQEAIRHLERALELNPANDKAQAGIARLRGQLVTRWACPICLAERETRFTTCPECRAVLDLAQGDAAIGNASPDMAKIRQGAARLSGIVKSQPTFEAHYYLGMALLNLAKPEQALAHFRSCRSLKPENQALAAQVELLEQAIFDAAQPTSRIPQVPIEPGPPARKSILVVDDSTIVRKLIGITMEKNGYRVIEAQDGKEALEVIEAQGIPDLVVLDVVMPGMDGYALCRSLRRLPATASIPIVLLTARDGVLDRMRGRLAGVSAYLAKPFEPAALVQVVREFCANGTAVPIASD